MTHTIFKPLLLFLLFAHNSLLVPTIKPSTSLSSELTAPARLRLPLYSFSSPSAQTFILPGLPPSRPPTTSSSTTQRLASLFGPRISPASTLDPELAEPADEPISLSVRILSSGPLASPTLDLAVRDALRNRIQDALGNLEQSVLAHITAFVDRLSLAPPDLPHALGSQLSKSPFLLVKLSIFCHVDVDLTSVLRKEPPES